MFLDVTWLERPKLFISSTMDKDAKATRREMKKKLEDLERNFLIQKSLMSTQIH